MQIKDRKKLLILFILSLLAFKTTIIKADEFNITANEILVDKENEILIGKGSVEAVDSEGKIINADNDIVTIDRTWNEFTDAYELTPNNVNETFGTFESWNVVHKYQDTQANDRHLHE